VPISRYADSSVPSGGLTTSMVALITDVIRDGKPLVGYGFASIGRFAQSGLIRERFAPRLLAARDIEVMDDAGTNLDPFRAWKVVMTGEKPGGHGERCVAVGALDMALWDSTVAALVSIGPRDELEGMLAAQLLAAHNAAMECYRRAMIGEQTFEGRRENLSQANKLSRTYAALLDALNGHRGKGQQKVTVEHVHVHHGGQAIVGTVNRG
jgi:hypothetical protein